MRDLEQTELRRQQADLERLLAAMERRRTMLVSALNPTQKQDLDRLRRHLFPTERHQQRAKAASQDYGEAPQARSEPERIDEASDESV